MLTWMPDQGLATVGLFDFIGRSCSLDAQQIIVADPHGESEGQAGKRALSFLFKAIEPSFKKYALCKIVTLLLSVMSFIYKGLCTIKKYSIHI